MNDNQLLRYSRQIMLPSVDFDGQQTLLKARVLVIGLGGLGSPIAMYLAAAGIGTLAICDHDVVDLSNLQRQIAHNTNSIGVRKTQSATKTLQALNPDTHIILLEHKLDASELRKQVNLADVVVDASDNFTTRFQLNEACVKQATPLVSGAAIRMEGQVSVFRNDQHDSPCYRCLYNDAAEVAETCSENGVLAPIVGIIGSIQATETLKILLNIGQELKGRVLILDGAYMEWRSITLKKDASCPVCSTPPTNIAII
ncbi:MAG: molybdopterin-synthase adenylyltransferase MoeB [Gammaproteobacteria bacterium]|nr:molybdopterin-synthase adenylyltransferase MoeB [Gammaproteobacteria bacterium]